MPKAVQIQTNEQDLFAVHKNPHFTFYVRVSCMRATFSVMNIRPNNILYQTLFVNCVPQAIVLYVYFLFHFYCSVDSVVSFSSSATSLQWSHRHLAAYLQCKVRLMHCMALCIAFGKVSRLF